MAQHRPPQPLPAAAPSAGLTRVYFILSWSPQGEKCNGVSSLGTSQGFVGFFLMLCVFLSGKARAVLGL